MKSNFDEKQQRYLKIAANIIARLRNGESDLLIAENEIVTALTGVFEDGFVDGEWYFRERVKRHLRGKKRKNAVPDGPDYIRNGAYEGAARSVDNLDLLNPRSEEELWRRAK